MNEQPEDDEYQLAFEFCVDSPAITPTERLYFVCGFEYAQVLSFLMARSETAFPRPIHSQNEFRLRSLVDKFGRTHRFTPCPDHPGWMMLDVGPVSEGEPE